MKLTKVQEKDLEELNIKKVGCSLYYVLRAVHDAPYCSLYSLFFSGDADKDTANQMDLGILLQNKDQYEEVYKEMVEGEKDGI